MTRPFAAVAAALLCGCALPQSQIPVLDGTVLQSTRDPAQYRAPLPRDFKGASRPGPEASGEACRTSVFFPPLPPAVFYGSNVALAYLPYNNLQVLVGDSSWGRAVSRARESVGGAEIVDLRADAHVTSFLGLLRRECVEVHGRALGQ